MKFSVIASAVSLVASAVANPFSIPTFGCLTPPTGDKLLKRFIDAFQLQPSDLGSANQTLQAIIAPKFQEISDSILSLEGRPLGGASETSKQSYINGLLNAPPTTGVKTIFSSVIGCDKIIWQWVFTGVGDKQYEVKGFNLFEVNLQQQITTLYVEFNSIAWGLDTGYNITFPAGGPPAKQ